MSDLSGRTIVVTGAAHGIGRAIAQRLHADGATVVLTDVEGDALREAAASLGGEPRAVAHAGDVRDVDALRAWLDERGIVPDGLVNNAAFAPRIPSLELDAERLREVLEVNVVAPVRLSRMVAEKLIAAGRPGCIVNVASVNAFRGIPEMLPYNASKAALVSATKTLGVEWARAGIRVNAVCPGSTRTRIWEEGGFSEEDRQAFADRNPLGRIAEPSEIAATVAFLVSDESSFVVGSALIADAGLTAVI